MYLKRARVTNFKSIDDSGWVAFDDVTCLVGKNESGKTAFLHALHKLSPTGPQSPGFDVINDFPSKGYTAYRKIHDTNPAKAVEAEFELSEAEVATLEAKYCKGILDSLVVTASKDYDNKRLWNVPVNEKRLVRSILDGAGLPADANQQLKKSETRQELAKLLGDLDNRPSIETLRQSIGTPTKALSDEIIDDYLVKWVPRFVYFDDYSTMRGDISIKYLRQKSNPDAADQTFLSLLELAGLEMEEFGAESSYEHIKRQLESASIAISNEVFRFWSQNAELRVLFDVSQANPNDEPPFNEGPILHVRVWNNRHQVSVPFSERSRGFVWFFSFLAYFSQLEDKTDLILLLDEPGLSLHAKAQADFLRFIDERLAPKYEVVYTTHSPFMVEPSKLRRVRLVQDIDNQGTVVSDDVLRTDKDTVFPLQAALGYDLAQTLFVGPHCLLVEGPSDILYLQLLSTATAAKGKAVLDPRWVIVPVGGADKLSTFVSLLGANKLNVAVLMDIASKDQQRIRNLQENALLRPDGLIRISEIVGRSDADIEDIFDEDFYLSLVSKSYKLTPPLTTAALPPGNPRIVKGVEAYFKDNVVVEGGFNHYLPAIHLLREQTALLPSVDDATLEHASAMFEKVNALLA